MNRNIFATGAVLCALAVAAGAWGAHGLRAVLQPYSLEVYKTAVMYHFLHATGLILFSLLPAGLFNRSLKIASLLLMGGLVLFSGSLYLLSTKTLWTTQSLSFLGPVTPLGGLLFISGWLVAAFGIFQKKS